MAPPKKSNKKSMPKLEKNKNSKNIKPNQIIGRARPPVPGHVFKMKFLNTKTLSSILTYMRFQINKFL